MVIHILFFLVQLLLLFLLVISAYHLAIQTMLENIPAQLVKKIEQEIRNSEAVKKGINRISNILLISINDNGEEVDLEGSHTFDYLIKGDTQFCDACINVHKKGGEWVIGYQSYSLTPKKELGLDLASKAKTFIANYALKTFLGMSLPLQIVKAIAVCLSMSIVLLLILWF